MIHDKSSRVEALTLLLSPFVSTDIVPSGLRIKSRVSFIRFHSRQNGRQYNRKGRATTRISICTQREMVECAGHRQTKRGREQATAEDYVVDVRR